MSREAMQQALEALEQVEPYVEQLVDYSSTASEWPLNLAPQRVAAAIAALRAALEAQQEPPFGWAIVCNNGTTAFCRPRVNNFFGAIVDREPFEQDDVTRCDREWPGLAPHRLVTLYAHPPAQPQTETAIRIPNSGSDAAMIYVGHGRFALCDWEDWPKVRGYWWNMTTRAAKTQYAQAWSSHDKASRKRLVMHRLILEPPENMLVDHINGDGLDNRRANLRLATVAQNVMNSGPRAGSSRFKGVSWDRESESWRASIRVGGKRLSLGRFQNEIEAAAAYNKASLQHFGDFARTNDV